jgi:pectate lyase
MLLFATLLARTCSPQMEMGLVFKHPAMCGSTIGLCSFPTQSLLLTHPSELSSDLNHGKDYYDGLVDITHASEWITVSNSYLHDHFKASLIGHSDSNGAEDTGHLHVTQHNNYWLNIGSRTPSLRFGTGHVFNSYFLNMNTGIDSRDGAQILAQSNVFSNVTEPIASLYSDDVG